MSRSFVDHRHLLLLHRRDGREATAIVLYPSRRRLVELRRATPFNAFVLFFRGRGADAQLVITSRSRRYRAAHQRGLVWTAAIGRPGRRRRVRPPASSSD